MKTVNDQKRQQARSLFFQAGKSQAEIAAEVGVSDKTLYLWTKEGDWRRLRSASNLMPSMIIENFYAQVQELNEDIRSRPPGKRYPTIQEAEIFRKMMLTIDRSKKKHTQGEYMELMQKFLEWLAPKNHEALQTVTDYADDFLKSRSVAGFHPYDIEYMDELSNNRYADQNSRHPELVSGPHDNMGNAEAGNDFEPTDPQPQVEFPTPPIRHPELVQEPHNNAEKAEPATSAPNTQPETFLSGSLKEQICKPETFLSGSLKEQICKPEIIGNYENPTEQLENQQQTPQNTPQNESRSVIMNESATGNNENPQDLYKGLSAGQAYQKYLALKKAREQDSPQEATPPEPSSKEEEGQLYSIGEKIFRMKPR